MCMYAHMYMLYVYIGLCIRRYSYTSYVHCVWVHIYIYVYLFIYLFTYLYINSHPQPCTKRDTLVWWFPACVLTASLETQRHEAGQSQGGPRSLHGERGSETEILVLSWTLLGAKTGHRPNLGLRARNLGGRGSCRHMSWGAACLGGLLAAWCFLILKDLPSRRCGLLQKEPTASPARRQWSPYTKRAPHTRAWCVLACRQAQVLQ